MKKAIIAILFFSVIFAFLSTLKREDYQVEEATFSKPRNGVAIIMAGAAAHIPQQAALLEELDKRGLLKNLVFISGVSSGALNAVLLNGIKTGKITWDEYKNILFNLKNCDIFFQENKKFPVNTEPVRQTYKRTVEDKLGYFHIGDLPITTSISFTHVKGLNLKKIDYRMCSRMINEESDTALGLVDIMMATSAFPIIFPPVRILHVKSIPDYEYVDGGIGEDPVPYHALLEFEKLRGEGVEKVFIIGKNWNSVPELSEELKGFGINDKGLFDKLGFSLDPLLKKGILKRMEAYSRDAPELLPLTYVWIPDLKTNFLLFDFEKMEEQYNLTSEWAKTNEPKLLKDFLLQNKERKK